MQHKFYQKSKADQIKWLFLLSGIVILVLLGFALISWLSGVYWIALIAFPLILSTAAPFIDTPMLKKSGKLIYCSNLFLMEKPQNGVIKIHGGTLFDYVFVLEKSMTGKQRTNYILQQYLEGLLFLIQRYESGEFQDYRLKGTSYILNRRNAQKMGFEIAETDNFQRIILIYNFFNLMIANSIAKKRPALPQYKNIKTYQVDLSELTKRKAGIQILNNRLQKAAN